MKIYNPFKRIKLLENKIQNLEEENELLREKKNETEHETGIWCNGCKNLMKEKVRAPFTGEYEKKFCVLDTPCKERVENGEITNSGANG